jgi:arginine/ornithine N-succinyltransferase beta subunit
MVKEQVAISIQYLTYKIDLFYVNAISLHFFNTKYNEADKAIKIKIRKFIRDLFTEHKKISTQIIIQTIVLQFLSPTVQEALIFLQKEHENAKE